MMRSKTVLVSLAAFGLMSATPAFASDSMRSAEALPSSTVSAVQAGGSAGCVAPTGSSSNTGTAPLSCGQWSAGSGGEGYYGTFGGADSWWIILLIAIGAAGLILALTGGDNDSPG